MLHRALPLELLSRVLHNCPFLSCEWSLKVLKDRLDIREKYICWIDNSDNQAAREIDLIRPMLAGDRLIADLDNTQIINLV